jgi:hypothetical protein
MAKKGGSQKLKDQNRWQLWMIIAANAVVFCGASTREEALAEFLRDYPSASRETAVAALSRAGRLLERDAPLDIS